MSLQRLLRPRKRIPFADYGYDVRRFDLPRDGVSRIRPMAASERPAQVDHAGRPSTPCGSSFRRAIL